ncbi:MAG TPA: biopolymer transporter ExbD [Thermoanaerobaculia bacterium]|jgi:biopolymer transport protein ExbD|nr:biopolymer transporter ExbD [Thermoanaerobaculia bacterium]
MNVSEKTAVRSEINVTPLVDVCLVLLIIFMVVTPLLYKQVEVQLPKTPGPGDIQQGERLIKVAILENGTIRVDGLPVPRAHLASTLTQMFQPDRPIAVEGDRRLSYGEVRGVLELIQRAGFRQVGLVAERDG